MNRSVTWFYDVLEWYIPAIIGGDFTGLEDREIKKLKSFITKQEIEAKKHGFISMSWTGMDEESFRSIDEVTGSKATCKHIELILRG